MTNLFSGCLIYCIKEDDMVAVMFPDIISHESTFEKIISMKVLEWLVSLVGRKIYGMIEFESRASRISLVGCSSF